VEQRLLNLVISEAKLKPDTLNGENRHKCKITRDRQFLERVTFNLCISWRIWIKQVEGCALANYKLLGLEKSARENVMACRWSD